MNDITNEIEQIKLDIISNLGRSLDCPADFEYLSEQIQLKTKEYISPTTLKRFFNYIQTNILPRISTLTLFARFVGYNGWNDYCESLKSKNDCQSVFLTRKCLLSSDLSIGDSVEVGWAPNRRCTFEYLGDKKYIVRESHNAKIQAGDTFSVQQFMLEQPLYLNDLRKPDNQEELLNYVAGYKTGLIYLVLNGE